MRTSTTQAAAELSADPRGNASGPVPPEPLSFAQQRLWFMEQLEPDGALYNVPVVVHLDGPVERRALSRAWDELVQRHGILRTRYPVERGRPRQEESGTADSPLRFLDLFDPAAASGPVEAEGEDAAAAAREAAADRIGAREAAYRFDLPTGPVCRAVLLRLHRETYRLLLTFHHIAVDGWSVEVLLRELAALYGAAVGGVEAGLVPAPLDYRAYARRQREQFALGRMARALDYWRATLGTDPPVPELPLDRTRPARRMFRGAVLEGRIGLAAAVRLREIGTRDRATLATTLLAAFHWALCEWTGRPAATVGLAVSGRRDRDLMNVVGCFANIVPVPVDLAGAVGFGEVLRRTRAAVRGALAHEDVPLDRIVSALTTRRATDYMPLFRVIFNHVAHVRPPAFTGLRGCSVEVSRSSGTSMFDLGLTVEQRTDGLRVFLQYDTDLFDQATAVGLLERYCGLLAHVADGTLGEPAGFRARPESASPGGTRLE